MHPYRTLQVALDDDSETIRQSYLNAIRRHPPESDPEGFRLINDAYDLIKTEDRRLMREIGLKTSTSYLDSPMGAALAYFQAEIDQVPPAEEAFYTFLQSS